MAITVTPENYLGIHFLPQVKEELVITDVGLEVNGNAVARLPEGLPWHVYDREHKRARKEVIRCAKLYHRLDARVAKPKTFALAYQKGRFDTFPEPVIWALKSHMEDQGVEDLLDINFDQVHKLGSNDFKYGDPTGDHVQVIRTSEEDGDYLIIFYRKGERYGDHEVNYQDPMEQWYA
ncbi:hypothetical protein VH22019_00073 [Vibrio phage VH2_2019]|nr:hypothetical protein VH22019_00073 [Vibrio phage VH2_2019]